MFGFKTRKKFFKSLNPGQIVKYRGYLSDQTILFEFGHYDEDEDIVYWQYARVVLGKWHLGDYVAMTAKVSDNGKLFEQQFSTNQKGWYSLADTKEIIRFEECTDKYMAGLWFEGKLQRNEVYLTERMDGRLSRLQLAIDPPEYVYVECDEDSGEFIFKCAGLSYSSSGNFKIQCKEMFLADDRPNLVSGDREFTICEYHHALVVREASESEIKCLLYACEEKKKEQMLKNKLPLFGSSFKTGDIMYADREHDSILFQYDHHQRIEGIEQMRCKGGVLKFGKDKKTKTFDYYGRVGSYDSLLTFRLADESEKTLFLKEREYEEDRRNKINIGKLIMLHPGTLLYIELKNNPGHRFLVPYGSEGNSMAIHYCTNGYFKISKTNPIEDYLFISKDTTTFFANYDQCSVIREADEDEKISFMCHYKSNSDKMSVEELRTLPEGVMLTAWYDTDTPNVPVRCTFRFKELDDKDGEVYIKYFDAVDYIHRKDGDEINVDMLPHDSSNIITMNTTYFKCYRSTQEEIDFYNKYIKEKGVPGKRIELNEVVTPEKNGRADLRFKPFSSKVLVSNGDGDFWCPAVFGCIVDDPKQFMIVGGQRYKFCVLYQNHRDLLGQKFKKEHLNG